MVELPKHLEEVVEFFTKLPGVGEKTAFRQTLQLTNWRSEDLMAFSYALSQLTQLKKCQKCNVYTDTTVCNICASVERYEAKMLCVVETLTDFLAIEKSKNFRGTYFILGNVLNPLMGIGPDEIGLDKLFERITSENIQNLILAINPSVEGDATCSYIRHKLPQTIKVERIGFGVPMGGSLEYLDSLTISKALENRKSL
ncbi:MAG: recombination protein RecR [Bacteriovoracaceae bacterium]|nr:recombination protein RecR [Bacteriovoracaceae bacterium]